MDEGKPLKPIAFDITMFKDAEAKAEAAVATEKPPAEKPAKEKQEESTKEKTELKPDETKSEKTTDKSGKAEEQKKEPKAEQKPAEQEKSSEKTLEEEEPSNEDDELFNKITGKIKEKYVKPEELNQLLIDLDNHQKFMAANTQRAQELADLRTRLGVERTTKAIDTFMSQPEFEELLEAADDWYKKGNPNLLRELVDALKTSVPAVQKLSKEQEELQHEKDMLETEKEILAVQRVDPSYTDEKKIDDLFKFAIDRKVDLMAAWELKESNSKVSKLTELQEKVNELRKELKERNK
jgi:hypothetical protein